MTARRFTEPRHAHSAEERLLRVEEVAEILAVSTRLVWRFRSEGRLPVVKLAGASRFRLSDVRRLMETGRQSGEVA